MKELIKPNAKEKVYSDSHAYCEVYDHNTGRYYTKYRKIGDIYADEESDDILF